MDVRMFTVGPVAENTYLLRGDGSTRGLFVDPGDEAPKLLGAVEALGLEVEAILITHCHLDHIGAVAPVARATGAPVYCPTGEVQMLRDLPAQGAHWGVSLEGWEPEHHVAGGDVLDLAGFEIEVLDTPGHSIGHVTYVIEDALFSGDVLFQSSIGRTDLPGGDHATLLRSIAGLLERFDDDTVVHPGHMGLTTIGRERATNPFLAELGAR
jgi:glyoxylase-like metal-dependent hydrolase (beta-lactamase superfamily II)